ncbi:hypothetical protein U9M48_022779 [Paspalum notatum var. saurae]|uniref:Filament-like plant protein 7 n=1 Tax=Paspalum notatum var. saurae TaxID=547442 RepID=A0AAQ3TIX7_PASNO
MAEMEEALRSCMERLVIVREEREQIIVEAANEISAEKKKVRELQHKLEDANKKAAKLAAENSSLRKAMDAKDAVIRELRESAAAAGGKLADAVARLESSQKQAGSLQYEVRMLQKELEVRGQEREYDLKSVDAARRQQAEHLKRIAELEAECQRLRAMVRKRLPGPAAIAKMRDEVEQQQQTPTASPRRPRPATPSSTRSVVAPFSPRTPSPRRSVSDAEGHAFKLRAVEDENRALKQALAKRESELQFVQMRYADEACKLTVVQRQLKELTEENKQLSDANSQSQSWTSALISELEQLRSGNDNSASIVASSEMDLLDDFAEIEKLEMASGDRRPSNVEHTSSKKADEGSVTQEQNGNGVDVSASNGHPKRVKDIWELVVHKHEASGESIETIIEQISRALEQKAIPSKRDDPDVPNDGSETEIEKIVRNMVEEITSMIHTSAEDDVARSGALLHSKSELLGRFEHLVQVCHDLLQGKCILEKFIDEVCLILKYIVSQYFADQDQTDTVNSNTENFDEVKSWSTVTTDGPHDIRSAKTVATLAIKTEAHEEPAQSVESQIMANHPLKLDTELMQVTQAQDDNALPGGKSAYCEKESSGAEANVEHWAAQEESQLAANSDILAAADRLAECQETITILSKQLQALKTPTSSGPPDSSICNPRPSSANSDYKKPQSLASILAEEFANAEASMSPTTPKQVQSKKDEDDVNATPTRSTARQEQSADVSDNDSAQIVVHPVFAAEPRQQDDASADLKRKKKRDQSLLGRIMFRKRVEG